jgi:hypothetical protein
VPNIIKVKEAFFYSPFKDKSTFCFPMPVKRRGVLITTACNREGTAMKVMDLDLEVEVFQIPSGVCF